MKALIPARFWLTSFMLANVLIDLEVLWYLYRRESPLHRWLHTYLGGIATGVLAGVMVPWLVSMAVRLLPLKMRRQPFGPQGRGAPCGLPVSSPACLAGSPAFCCIGRCSRSGHCRMAASCSWPLAPVCSV